MAGVPLSQSGGESVISMAVRNMKAGPELNTWFARLQSIKQLLNVNQAFGKNVSVSRYFDYKVLIDVGLTRLIM